MGRAEPESPPQVATQPPPHAPGPAAGTEAPPSEEEIQAHLSELRDQLAKTPVEAVIAQLAYQLFEVAALHLSLDPPQIPQARTAIDAMAALVEGLGERLGEHAGQLRDGLTQIRLAFVQVQKGTPEDS